jgi:hypothetical protein
MMAVLFGSVGNEALRGIQFSVVSFPDLMFCFVLASKETHSKRCYFPTTTTNPNRGGNQRWHETKFSDVLN